MTQKRKQLSGSKKLALVKRYLVERAPIMDLYDSRRPQPSQIYRFYRWQAAIFEHGGDAFDLEWGRRTKAAESAQDDRIAEFKAVVAQNDDKTAQKGHLRVDSVEAPR
jgi:hypothetical protein